MPMDTGGSNNQDRRRRGAFRRVGRDGSDENRERRSRSRSPINIGSDQPSTENSSTNNHGGGGYSDQEARRERVFRQSRLLGFQYRDESATGNAQVRSNASGMGDVPPANRQQYPERRTISFTRIGNFNQTQSGVSDAPFFIIPRLVETIGAIIRGIHNRTQEAPGRREEEITGMQRVSLDNPSGNVDNPNAESVNSNNRTNSRNSDNDVDLEFPGR